MPPAGTASSSIVRLVAALSRRFLALGCRRVRVLGSDAFVRLLTDPQRAAEGRGIVSLANHISVLDEPLMWGTLPRSLFQQERTVRWSLGASDIIFKNELCRWFFHRGQTWEVFRGQGIYQPAINHAITRLGAGSWVHIFPEGRVNLSRSTRLRRFKWGVSRLILEAPTTPYVVPIWLTGFDQVMPEPRAPPRWRPRLGADISVAFGAPIHVDPFVLAHRTGAPCPAVAAPDEHIPHDLHPSDHPAYAAIRSHLAAHLRASLAHHGEQTRIALGYGAGEGTLVHRASYSTNVCST